MKDNATTSQIMFDCILALVPALAFGVYNFGLQALYVVLVSVAAACVAELICGVIFRRGLTIKDLSAVVSGLIFALTMPPEIPLWIAACGAGFAIIVVKHVFGGLGKNILNPAACARTIMMFVFAGYMTTFTYHGIIAPAPLVVVEGGGQISLLQMFIGNTAGNIGETSAIALIVGGLYLLYRRIMHWRIPLFILLTVAVYISIYSLFFRGGFDGEYLLAHLLGGGLLLCACFMASDCVTSPVTPLGQVVYAVIIGVVICTARLFFDNIGAASYAVVIGNLFALLINYITLPRSFGRGAREKARRAASQKAEEEKEIAKEQEAFERLKKEIITKQRFERQDAYLDVDEGIDKVIISKKDMEKHLEGQTEKNV